MKKTILFCISIIIISLFAQNINAIAKLDNMFKQIVDQSLSENSNFESIGKLVSNYNEQVGEDFDFKTYIYDFETKQMVSVKSRINNQVNTHLTKNTLDQYAITGPTDGKTRVMLLHHHIQEL